MDYNFYVYIMSNKSGTLYTGFTNDLEIRTAQHKSKTIPGFTSKYNIGKLLYYEHTTEVWSGLAREKQLKGWSRAKKLALIKTLNPKLVDLSLDWYKTG